MCASTYLTVDLVCVVCLRRLPMCASIRCTRQVVVPRVWSDVRCLSYVFLTLPNILLFYMLNLNIVDMNFISLEAHFSIV